MLKLTILSLFLFTMSGCMWTAAPEVKPIEKSKVKKPLPAPKKVVNVKKHHEVKKTIHKKRKKVIKKVTPAIVQQPVEKLFQTVPLKKATLLQKGVNKEHCAICGMNLVKYYKTNHAAKFNGQNIQYCSLHCLAKHIKEGAELENPMVVDVKTLKFIPVTEAFYVVGSNVKGTMSKTSKYAFKSLADAKAFKKEHGGKILDFYSAWQIAKKDFK
jgi:hypothetical protein